MLTSGARPLFFVDYVGLHAIDHSGMDGLVGGMAAAWRENGGALLGGAAGSDDRLRPPRPSVFAPRTGHDRTGIHHRPLPR